MHTPAPVGYVLTRLVGLLLRDVVFSLDEVEGLMVGLLTSAPCPKLQQSWEIG